MKEDEIKLLVDELSKRHSPATIGHILRDRYNLRIKKLTKFFPNLNQDKSYLERISLKIRYMKFHLESNKKDYCTERSLQRLLVKQKRLRLKIGI